MALPEGYTGPTGGRMVLNADGTSEYVRFYDKPLTADEERAVAEFLELSPNGRLRKVIEMQDELRRLRWNDAELRKGQEDNRRILKEFQVTETRLRLTAAQRPPEGYSRPAIVRDLMEHAERAGWAVRWAWQEPDEAGDVRLDFRLTRGEVWRADLYWVCQPGGKGRRVRPGLIRRPGQDWSDAPSVVKLKEILLEAVQDG